MHFDRGTTHVSVGFCDLSELLGCQLLTESPLPLRFIGFESSLCCVAKTKVLVEMMKNNCETKSIVEVWWSSGWGATTLREFELGVDNTLFQTEINAAKKIQLLNLLKFWKNKCSSSSCLSRKEFEKRWLKDVISTHLNPVYTLKRRRDRMDFLDYILSGNVFFEEEQKVVGNVTMFQRPSFVGEKSTNESFFRIIDFARLKVDDPNDTSFFDCCRGFLVDMAEKLKSDVVERKIVVEVSQRFVTKKDAEEIRAQFQPYTMNWSNILDYMRRTDFLELARACSGPETIHFCHSMNWMQDVWGMDIYDYPSANRSNVAEKIENMFSVLYPQLLKKMSIGEYLNETVPPTNIKNIFSYVMMSKYHINWKNYYFEGVKIVDVFPMSFTASSRDRV